MTPSLDLDRSNPLRYLLSTVVVWIVVAGVVEFTFADGRAVDAVVTGTFGGLAFGVATLLLQRHGGS
ncbi:hypothetical protein SAMN04488066_10884 [Halorubrum aquaticum]|uniref:Uncharacterized protein n=1 Tax=Halorubrum aquaticum TaxID=387340 RepID=A0A1I3AZX9_9EURY|nr:hypothetical protein [Halorubrum aquaticum]SFH55500.1 hypothetical protein SAMN04488066_10884 [Halorubrum aquaticum]